MNYLEKSIFLFALYLEKSIYLQHQNRTKYNN